MPDYIQMPKVSGHRKCVNYVHINQLVANGTCTVYTYSCKQASFMDAINVCQYVVLCICMISLLCAACIAISNCKMAY